MAIENAPLPFEAARQASGEGFETMMRRAFCDPDLAPSAQSRAAFFRQYGTAFAAMRRMGFSLSFLAQMSSMAGWTLTEKAFSKELSRHKPKGLADVERALAKRGLAGKSRLLRELRLVDQELPRLEGALPEFEEAAGAPHRNLLAVPYADSRKDVPPSRTPHPARMESQDSNASTLPARPQAPAAPSRIESAAPMRQAPSSSNRHGFALPGTVAGVFVDRDEPYLAKPSGEIDKSEYVDDGSGELRPPFAWLVEACALNVKHEKPLVVLRNGASINVPLSRQPALLSGAVATWAAYRALK